MVEELGRDALLALMEAEADVQIVDVRPEAGFDQGHIPGSVNVPFERLVSAIDSVTWGDRVVFVCPYGHRSRQAGELLRSYEGTSDGVEIYNLSGGLDAWNGPISVTESA